MNASVTETETYWDLSDLTAMSMNGVGPIAVTFCLGFRVVLGPRRSGILARIRFDATFRRPGECTLSPNIYPALGQGEPVEYDFLAGLKSRLDWLDSRAGPPWQDGEGVARRH